MSAKASEVLWCRDGTTGMVLGFLDGERGGHIPSSP